LASPHSGIDCLLSVLKLEASDTFYDLGCGDGRVVTSVVKRFGCKGVGVDLNGPLVRHAQCRAREELADTPELLENVSFVQKDIGKMDLGDASAVYIYMPQDALHSLCSRVLPCTGIPDGALIYTEEYWLHDRAALRHCKWRASHWNGHVHCYEWQCAYGKPERSTF
jgi:SAM-dependent methyltransferase